ncbi:hypothetical protein COCVIDRAFT_110634 [Bipolaris victoriae FI3]|uniref:Uncharacterized protein n=1 Tax=Bipolaris victoriae (strain FI3) TaxID=930091 RepID=W7E3F0_BIPV3|nr:hypothetical protein COCVIDRAFT_110634 [Bipolaris victoriae FI3]
MSFFYIRKTWRFIISIYVQEYYSLVLITSLLRQSISIFALETPYFHNDNCDQ